MIGLLRLADDVNTDVALVLHRGPGNGPLGCVLGVVRGVGRRIDRGSVRRRVGVEVEVAKTRLPVRWVKAHEG